MLILSLLYDLIYLKNWTNQQLKLYLSQLNKATGLSASFKTLDQELWMHYAQF